MPYRDPSENNSTPTIEDGLRDVLGVLAPFNEEETTSILAAVAALYDLPLERTEPGH
jgi:hypothetical protein